MFGVASNFRKTHGEAAFTALATSAFADADVDGSGCIDTSELQTTLKKMGMTLTDAQTAAIVNQYDDDGNHELDESEFLKLVSDLIDGSAASKLPMAARKSMEKAEARGVVKSMDDLFGSDDDEPKGKKASAPPKKSAAAAKAPTAAKAPAAAAKASAGAAQRGSGAAAPPASAGEAALRETNQKLADQNRALTDRVQQLEAQLAKAGSGGGGAQPPRPGSARSKPR